MGDESRPTVLVVDDDERFTAELGATLNASGYHVLEAHDVESAMRLFDTGTKIDLALVDLNLPDNSGLVIVHTVHRQDPHPKILAITAVMSDLHLEIATYMGADRAIRKFPRLANQSMDAPAWCSAVGDLISPPSLASN